MITLRVRTFTFRVHRWMSYLDYNFYYQEYKLKWRWFLVDETYRVPKIIKWVTSRLETTRRYARRSAPRWSALRWASIT